MDEGRLSMAQRVAQVAGAFQQQNTGRAPKAVTVALAGDTIVITLHDALTPAEEARARRPRGAAQVQQFYYQLFAGSAASLRQEIKRITGVAVREAVAEVDAITGVVVHAFTSGNMVEVFLLAQGISKDAWNGHRPRAAPDDREMDEAMAALELASSNLALVRRSVEGDEAPPCTPHEEALLCQTAGATG